MLVAAARTDRAGPAPHRLLPAAAGAAAAPLLRGPERPGEVVASTRDMVAVHVKDAGQGLLCVTSRWAVRLPCAMVVNGPVPKATVGTPARVGDGRLRLPGVAVTAARWWAAHRPVIADLDTCQRRSGGCPAPDLDPAVVRAAAVLGCALRSPALSLDDAVSGLLGLGPGLTPVGDDVLAGALVALRAVRSPAVGRLADAIAAAGPFERTTTVSAGLLAHAAHGWCVPELTGFLHALGGPGSETGPARRRLLGVGHTSGTGLYAGALCALAGPGSLAPHWRRM